MLLPLAALLIFGAIFCLVLGLASGRSASMSMRLATIKGERPMMDYRAGAQNESIGSRVFAPMAQSLGGKLESSLPSRWIQGIEHSLIRAGQPTTTTGFLFAALLVEGATLAMGFALAMAAGGISAGSIALIGVMGLFGLAMPKVWLSNR